MSPFTVQTTELLEQISDAFYALDHAWRFIYLNAQAEQLLQHSRDQLIGRSVWEAFPQARQTTFWVHYHHAVANQLTVSFEEYYAPLNRWFDVRVYPTDLGLSVYFHDISQRKQSELVLREREEWLNRVIETNADGIVIMDVDGNVVLANAAAERILGLQRSAMLARAYDDPLWQATYNDGTQLPPEHMPFAIVMRTGRPVYNIELAVHSAGTQRVMLSINGAPLRSNTGQLEGVVISFNDVTALRKSQATQHLLVQAGTALADTLDHAQVLERIVRLVVPEFAHWCVVQVLDEQHLAAPIAAHSDPAKEASIERLYEQYPLSRDAMPILRQVLDQGQTLLIKDCDDPLFEQLVVAPGQREHLTHLGCDAILLVPLIARSNIVGMITFVSITGGRHYDADAIGLAEELARRAAMAIDNARLYAETQRALQSRDDLFSAVTHDLQNPLSAIQGYAQLLQRRAKRLNLEQPQRLLDGLEQIERSALKMGRQINELLDFARIRSGLQLELHPVLCDVIALLRQVVAEQDQVSHLHTVVVLCSVESVVGMFDQERLERVFNNLIANAIKYSPSGGRVIVKAELDADRLRIAISDQGIGIPAAELPAIFQRFYRASNVGTIRGSGIGLMSARSIVAAHGGTITVDSQLDHGTTFTLFLPIGGAPAAAV